MALEIENPAVEELARELAKRMGESIDEAVAIAIRERLARNKEARAKAVHEAIRDFRAAVAGLPVADTRTADDILGYDEFGLPH